MKRRALVVAFLAFAAATPSGGQAQAPAKSYRVAVMFTVSPLSELTGPNPSNRGARGFVRGLRDLGYAEGHNLVLDMRSCEGRLERFEEIATDVLRLKPDAVVVISGPLVTRFSKLSTAVPVVSFFGGDELIRAGLMQSYARPGGNVTGVTLMQEGVEEKRLEMLLEAAPKATRIAYLATEADWETGTGKMLVPLAKRLNRTLYHARLVPPNIGEALALIERDRPDAVFFPPGPIAYGYRREIGQFAATSGIPTICAFTEFVEYGCLMSYGVDVLDQMRQAAGYVAKILKGVKPGDLPVEQPTKFELVINMKTAKALGITLPQSILLRADRMIE